MLRSLRGGQPFRECFDIVPQNSELSRRDELIKYLDDILSGLRYQDGHYDLVKLHDKEYQDKLQ